LPGDELMRIMAGIIAGEPGVFSAAVEDPVSGRRWLVNPRRLRSASLIKIFIMAEAFRLAAGGELDLDARLTVRAEDRVGGAGALEHAAPGTIKSLRELIEVMIVESDNTATNLIIDRLGMDAINTMIGRLGCRDTVLRRKMMDFAAAEAGRENFTSPADVTAVLSRLYRRECVTPEADEAMVAILLRQEDRCKIPLHLPAGVAVACKSGELEGAEHDAGIVYGSRRHYCLAVMSDELPDAERGRAAIARLARAVYDYWHEA
jgi:beta-lactamase class A